jgi:hypothetical protein
MGITFARRCCVDCRRTTALEIWPWSGRLLVTSHGLCAACLEEREPTLSPAGGAHSTFVRRVWMFG